ncbi:MAG: hypothetical protein NUW12_09510 [Firmicutes bacterium]|nr:hypothetical protein [Bacillota bacterium]MDH7496225.1 hypothetical protein [Bacillota bacterium]
MASERTGVLFKDALIYKESGDPFARGDLLVEGNRIRKIAYRPERLASPAEGSEHAVIEASNLALVPGFVDAHTHPRVRQ